MVTIRPDRSYFIRKVGDHLEDEMHLIKTGMHPVERGVIPAEMVRRGAAGYEVVRGQDLATLSPYQQQLLTSPSLQFMQLSEIVPAASRARVAKEGYIPRSSGSSVAIPTNTSHFMKDLTDEHYWAGAQAVGKELHERYPGRLQRVAENVDYDAEEFRRMAPVRMLEKYADDIGAESADAVSLAVRGTGKLPKDVQEMRQAIESSPYENDYQFAMDWYKGKSPLPAPTPESAPSLFLPRTITFPAGEGTGRRLAGSQSPQEPRRIDYQEVEPALRSTYRLPPSAAPVTNPAINLQAGSSLRPAVDPIATAQVTGATPIPQSATGRRQAGQKPNNIISPEIRKAYFAANPGKVASQDAIKAWMQSQGM